MLIDDLKDLVGPKGWITDPALLEPRLTEWRGALHGATPILVAPSTTAEVSAVVRACGAAGVAVVPQGGNTGLCGGAIPDASGHQVLLSLSRLNRIRSVSPDDYSMTVEAGCVLADVQRAARASNRLFPLSLGAEGTCQIGGNLSTNAGGINVIRYGTARQQVLGLEVVLANGAVWDGLRRLRKDTAGYDVKQLFIGSEGTLGIITAAALRLYPVPGESATALAALDSAADAVSLLTLMRKHAFDLIQAFELVSEPAIDFVLRHVPGTRRPFETDCKWYVLIETAGSGSPAALEDALAEAFESSLIRDATVAKNEAEAGQLWRIRHSISEAQKSEGASLKHDIAVPVDAVGLFLAEAERVVASAIPDARPVIFGHVGDGNLHYNISQPEGADPVYFLEAGAALTDRIYELVTNFGGTVSAEHGIGVLKKDALARYRPSLEIEMMRTLKKALDPANLLNPGKVI